MKQYELMIYVSAISETDEEYPDTGDFEGSVEWDDEFGCGIFDGTYTVTVNAKNEEQAKVLAKEMYEEKANVGILKDCAMSDIDVLSVKELEQDLNR